MSDQIDELEKLLVDGKSIDPTKLRPRLMKGGVYGYEIEANELKAFLSHIEAYTLEQSRKATEALLESIGEPLLSDFDTPTPAEHKKMVEVVKWYSERLSTLTKQEL